MLPEADLVKKEIILRDLVLSSEVKISHKKQIRWLAISMGLISPGESRTLVFDVFEVILGRLEFPFTSDNIVEDVCKLQKTKKDDEKKIDKAVRYHLTRLVKMGFLERNKRQYNWLRADMTDDPIESLKIKTQKDIDRIFKNMKSVYSSYKIGNR